MEADAELAHLDERLRDRVLAATAHSEWRLVRAAPDGGYLVDAMSGDRVVHMALGVRPDGSVWEETTSFLRQDDIEPPAADHAPDPFVALSAGIDPPMFVVTAMSTPGSRRAASSPS